jgi:aspartate-semialdehyde dehydrogenase
MTPLQDSPSGTFRVAIAGASSLLGKELKQSLEESAFPAAEIRLLDEEIAAGTLTELGGEPAVVETVDEDSFEKVRIAFFTGSPAFTVRHGVEARRSGAVVIDLSGGMSPEPTGKMWIPELDRVMPPPANSTPAGEPQSLYLVPSAAAQVAISLSAALQQAGLVRLAITFLQPASERGPEGIQELENQVVNLLSFQPVPKTVFGAQAGFNLLSEFGEDSVERLGDARSKIAAEVRMYLGGRIPAPAIALAQAPVFFSLAFSAFAEFSSPPDLERITEQLKAAGLRVVRAGDDPPNNVSVAGESQPMLATPALDSSIPTGVWFWGAADNLAVPAAAAVTIAEKVVAS